MRRQHIPAKVIIYFHLNIWFTLDVLIFFLNGFINFVNCVESVAWNGVFIFSICNSIYFEYVYYLCILLICIYELAIASDLSISAFIFWNELLGYKCAGTSRKLCKTKYMLISRDIIGDVQPDYTTIFSSQHQVVTTRA